MAISLSSEKRRIDGHEFMKKYQGTPAEKKQAVEDLYIGLRYFVEDFIQKHARTFKNLWEDIEQEAWKEILQSIDKYDPDKAKLTTFCAPSIKHAISVCTNHENNKTSQYFSDVMNTVKAAVNEIEASGMIPTDASIVIESGLSHAQVSKGKELLKRTEHVSLSEIPDLDSIGNFIPSPEDMLLNKEKIKFWTLAFDFLTEMEKSMFLMYYTEEKSSYTSIGKLFGKSTNEVAKIIERARRKLAHNQLIRDYYKSDRKTRSTSNKDDISVINTVEEEYCAEFDGIGQAEVAVYATKANQISTDETIRLHA